MYSVIINQINKQTGFRQLADQLKGGTPVFSLFGVADSMKPFFLACLNEAIHSPVIFIAKNSKDARRLYDEGYIPNAAHFPSKDMEFQRFDARSREDENQRVAALKALLNQTAGVVFTSYDALLPKLTPADLFKNQLLEIETGNSYPIEDIFRACVRLGYNPESLVEGEGAIAKRGSIIDIYIPAESAYRIDFFGDEVESIRQFDPLTQRTLETSVSKITISSATEFVLDAAAIPRAVKTLTEETEKTPNSQTEEDITLIQSGQSFEGIDKYLYAFYDGASLFDYTNSPVIVYDSQDLAKKEADVYFNECKHDWMVCTASGEAGSGQIHNLFPVETVDSILQGFPQVEFASIKRSPDFAKSKEFVFQIKSPAAYLHRLDMLAADIKLRIDQGFKPRCFTGDERNSRILKNAFVQGGISSIDEIIIPAPLESGAEFPESKCLILGEKDIFGFRKKRAEAPSRETALDIFTDLDEGDIVVHELHGRGRFLGLFTMEVQGKKRDYILLEYKDGDKLYIPTEQIDRVQKYIGGEAPALSKLGGREWDAAKAKVSKSIKKLAVDLVSVYSDRSGSKGFVFSPDSAWQDDFESSFPYQETDGQIKCVAEIKKDMESKKVMDRLLLGDVGYGKTEVAMRACFKAVYDQKQVAVLVPTTLLARQHFETFSERFKGFPVKVAHLSRFVAEKEKKKTLAALAEGNIDIVIGTHALLSERVKYKNLGLLVIDEEQHFGVGHKERIKDLKRSVDVLTLSATPIPRTLEMSLIGIRDMSMLKTPPVQRQKIKTYVMEYSRQLLARAISREIARGGQTYFVCRRIGQMDYLLKEIKFAVPEARAAAVHGQMNEQAIENIMIDFYNGNIDVLLATTIIESGLDIPNCNTLVVYEADKYGLSQLYQLKGRIGRSEKKAVCYLTYLKGDFISDTARKRLDAINQNTEFGAGFKIAMKDLEIRGAGNLLGPEQSGHMASVGYDMYCKLMRKAVSEIKGEDEADLPECSVELAVDAFIPPDYIDDDVVKVEVYKRIAAVKDTLQAKDVQEELKDRFGPLPLPVKNLITTSLVKAFGERAGFALITRQQNVFRLKYAEETRVDFQKLLTVLDDYRDTVKLISSEPPAIVFHPQRAAIQELFTFLNGLMRCIMK